MERPAGSVRRDHSSFIEASPVECCWGAGGGAGATGEDVVSRTTTVALLLPPPSIKELNSVYRNRKRSRCRGLKLYY